MSQIRIFFKKIPYVLSLYIFAFRIYNLVLNRVRIITYYFLAAFGADFKAQVNCLSINRPKIIIAFDPKDVSHGVNRKHGWVKPKYFYFGGDWDQSELFIIDESGTAETIQHLFVDKLPYWETKQYKEMLWAVESGHPKPKKIGAYWCKSVEDIDDYFNILLRAYETIKTEGYKTQAELAEVDSNMVRHITDEIRLYIDRNGNLLLGHGGTHRLLIAKLLLMPAVPGLISGVHEKWAKFCHDYYGNKSLEKNIREAIKERWDLY